MREAAVFEHTILKILTGLQAGAEVSLVPGEYTIGSGPDDDIQFIDVSQKPGQARLRVSLGKIEIAGGSGALVTDHGLAVAAGSDEWQEIEPLDIITAGTTRFALGPPNANWTTLAGDDNTPNKNAPRARRQVWPGISIATFLNEKKGIVQMAAPAAILVIIFFGIAVWYFMAHGNSSIAKIERDDKEAVRVALDQFAFGKTIDLKREVDGTIYVTGFVETAVERRALLGAVEKTTVPVRFRVGVLQSLREEVDGLIVAEKLPITFTLSSSGDLTLEGVMLGEDAVQRFLERIKSTIIGLNKIDSNIRTAKSLLSEIEKLGRLSQIDSVVLFRLDGELIEANGVLPVEKIDSWVGFLQAYSRRFSKDIGLRSFVQLQTAMNSSGDSQALVLGGKASGGDILLDIERLKRGEYAPSELFAGKRRQSGSAVEVAATVGPTLTKLPKKSTSDPVADKYLPLFLRASSKAGSNFCRTGSRLTVDNLPGVLFQLDRLSLSTTTSLSDLDREEQSLILEAALEPTLVSRCLSRAGSELATTSLYLTEASRNPGFIRFVTRNVQPHALDIAGVNIIAKDRYIQTRDGQKMREGAAPDNNVRLSVVGELGIALEGKNGLATVLYGPQLNWLMQK